MRPYIICHMMASIDGRIDCEMTEHIGGNEYYDALAQLNCDSNLSGRVTMQMHYALSEPFVATDSTPIGRSAFYKAVDSDKGYNIALDSKGRLRWPDTAEDEQPLLVITSEKAPNAYLETLRKQQISWIAVGKEEVDLERAVEMLNEQFGVKRLAVVGGGHINGAFLKAGLLDEVSVVVGAGIDGRKGMTAVFDGIDDPSFPTTTLKLNSVERIGEQSVWMCYAFHSVQEWDKIFPQSDKVNHSKVTFRNRYGITLVADLYVPKQAKGKMAAIAISGPFGAVKEQAAGLYAQTLAERGFLTIAFDPSYTGESSGEPRYVASPDINTEDFCAAVDYLSTRADVDPERIGILGICGWGGMALNAAAIDTRIKATVTSTMYDMSRVTANGYFDSMDADARYELRKQLNAQRTEDYKNGSYALAGGVPDTLPDDAPQFFKDYHAYYKTPRGYHKRSLNSNGGWNKTSSLSFLNMPILSYSDEIRSAVFVIHGEQAHSRYFSEDAFKKLKGDNKELLIIPGTNHTDLYDNLEKIPFDKIESFFNDYLK